MIDEAKIYEESVVDIFNCNLEYLSAQAFLSNKGVRNKEVCNGGVACSLFNLGCVHCKSHNLLQPSLVRKKSSRYLPISLTKDISGSDRFPSRTFSLGSNNFLLA